MIIISFSPGRCSMVQQHGPGRHQATAAVTRRRKWTQDDNRMVMKCYYESVPSKNGYRKRMLQLWLQMDKFPVTEQRLVDQANQIRKRKWLSDLEMEEIKRMTDEGEPLNEVGDSEYQETEVLNETNADAQMHSEETARLNGKLQLVEGSIVSPKEVEVIEKIEEILKRDRMRLPPLRGIERSKLRNAVQAVNAVLGKIVTTDITSTNDLIYGGSVIVNEMVGIKRKENYTRKQPWWKRRLEQQITDLNRDLGRVNAMIEGKRIKQKHTHDLQNRYKIKQKGFGVAREEIKQRIAAKTAKIKRYSDRISQYQQNRTFQNNQKRFYQNVDCGEKQKESQAPQSEQARDFWSSIWSKKVGHNKEAKWLQDFRKEMERQEQQGMIEITEEKIRKFLQRLPNWKAPGPDMVQGYWFKYFTSMHKSLKDNLADCLKAGKVPEWMTKGKTVLIQKDPAKGNDPSNYRPITCLPLAWKILTGIIAEEAYTFLEQRSLLPEEQKGCRKGSRGTGDLLYIDRMLLQEVKRRNKNLAMAWIDYRKAYDLVPHSWILECLENLGVNEEIRRIVKESMKSWKVELTCGNDVLGEVKIERGIFQGDSLSPLLFVIILIPLTNILRKASPGYEFASSKEKINHLLYMDDLKLYTKTEKRLTL